MDYLTTRGLVLRTTEYKETDRILTVLSADHGLLTMKARGVRSNRSKLKGACQLLTYAEFTVGEAHGFSSIAEATAIEMFPELRTDIVLLSLASYFAQLAEVLSQEDAAHGLDVGKAQRGVDLVVCPKLIQQRGHSLRVPAGGRREAGLTIKICFIAELSPVLFVL